MPIDLVASSAATVHMDLISHLIAKRRRGIVGRHVTIERYRASEG